MNPDDLLFLLRHLGAQTERELRDSLRVPPPVMTAELRKLREAGKIERQGLDRWRIVPGASNGIKK